MTYNNYKIIIIIITILYYNYYNFIISCTCTIIITLVQSALYTTPLLVGLILTQTSLLPLARTPSRRLARSESLKNNKMTILSH